MRVQCVVLLCLERRGDGFLEGLQLQRDQILDCVTVGDDVVLESVD